MNALSPSERERLDLLLIDLATEGLDDQRRRELDQLLERAPDVDPEDYELAAAALDLALSAQQPVQPMALTPELQARILAEAQSLTAAGSSEPPGVATPEASAPIHDLATERRRRSSAWPWAFAAAAALFAIAGTGYFYGESQSQRRAANDSRLLAESARVEADSATKLAGALDLRITELEGDLTVAQQDLASKQTELAALEDANADRLVLLLSERDALVEREGQLLALLDSERNELRVADQLITQLEIEKAELELLLLDPSPLDTRGSLISLPGTVRIPWSAGDDAWMSQVEVTGEVVWNQSEQSGVMTFAGMPQNDPGEIQYQLWIFDREQQNPVDGGVFNLNADGELAVHIDPKLSVGEPFLFAVTLEKPGGVVVSGRDHIVLTAPVGS